MKQRIANILRNVATAIDPNPVSFDDASATVKAQYVKYKGFNSKEPWEQLAKDLQRAIMTTDKKAILDDIAIALSRSPLDLEKVSEPLNFLRIVFGCAYADTTMRLDAHVMKTYKKVVKQLDPEFKRILPSPVFIDYNRCFITKLENRLNAE
jgi:hypothetical protein